MARRKRRTRQLSGFGILPAVPLLVPLGLAAAAGVGFLVVRAKKAAAAAVGYEPQLTEAGLNATPFTDTALADAATAAAARARAAQATLDALNKKAADAQAAAGILTLPTTAAQQEVINRAQGDVIPTAPAYLQNSPLMQSVLDRYKFSSLPPMLHGFLP